jgi:hypothetical protein
MPEHMVISGMCSFDGSSLIRDSISIGRFAIPQDHSDGESRAGFDPLPEGNPTNCVLIVEQATILDGSDAGDAKKKHSPQDDALGKGSKARHFAIA